MDNLGTEVGQKMRCAVKAKLIELGTGSTSGGYIDDELPDYVMIMVANKRSKKQMRDDLQLFLNENTDTFVNWLHQVLDKLQEVTLPPAITQKISGKSASVADSKKDKKSKKTKRSQKEQSPSRAPDKQASITDVFADQLIGKAKRSLEIESQAPVKKQEARKEVTATLPSVQELVKAAVVNSKRKELEELEQIQKQIDEAKRQLKIIPGEPMEAAPAEKSPEQDEDDDFLNLKADDLDDVDNDSQSKTDTEAPATTTAGGTPTQRRNRSPIVFDRFRNSRHSPEPRRDTEPRPPPAKERLGGGGDRKTENIISLSAHRQMERELYTPVHRRKEDNSNASQSSRRPPRNSSTDRDSRQRHRQSDSIRDRRRSGSGVAERDRNVGHHRQRSPHRRERPASPQREPRRPFRERERDRGTPPLPSSRATRIEVTRTVTERKESPTAPVLVERLPIRQRIGSRVIVAPPKQLEEEEEVDVPVSSVVTVKPRPVIAKNRQANKNLLLRAMADAQKSMVGTLKQQQLETPGGGTTTTTTTATLRLAEGGGIKGRLGGITNIAKRQRSQINAIVSSLDPMLKRQKPNQKIIIEIGPNDGFSESDVENDEVDEEVEEDAVVEVKGNGLSMSVGADLEYVPKPIEALSTRSKDANIDTATVAEAEEDDGNEGAVEDPAPNTQFVVTLDGAYKKAAAVTGLRNRLDLPKRRDVMKKNATAEKPQKQPEVNVRPRASSRNANAEEKIVPRATRETRAERAPGQLVDLRQRVEERRNGSPAKRRLGGLTTSPTIVNSTEARPTRKRRSPIKFTDKRSDNGERVLDAKEPIEESLDVPTQRKRIRISNSPAREESKATANGDESKAKASVVVVMSKEKEKRDPKKYDNIPSLLSSVAVPPTGSTIGKVLERCKFFPNCTRGDACEFVHPATNCKTFPNCKYGESCLYIHPKCKFDLACVRPDCNFSHTPASASATPLSSHVVPVQNYKSISAASQMPVPTICRFYPNCQNSLCAFFHPKMCYFGPSCTNKMECNFYHHEMPAADKFKWVSTMSG